MRRPRHTHVADEIQPHSRMAKRRPRNPLAALAVSTSALLLATLILWMGIRQNADTESEYERVGPRRATAGTKSAKVDPMLVRVAHVNESLVAARSALAQQDLDLTRQHLDRADAKKPPKEQRAQIDNLRKLVGYVDRFYEALVDGAERMREGRQLRLRGKALLFAGFNGRTIRFRTEDDQIKAIDLKELPPSLADRIARTVLDRRDPSVVLYYGAYHALHPNGDRHRASYMWSLALREGLTSDALVAELDLPRYGYGRW